MHHYPFHPGDYMLSTAHLTIEEDATYRRALDHYYDTEAPLALDKRTLSKRLRVDEQTLSDVLKEFFVETPEGWKHARCDAEIARYKAKSEKAKAAGALGGAAKSSKRQANAKRTPSKNVANQEPEPRTNNQEPSNPPVAPKGASALFDSPEFCSAWERWKRHRIETKHPLKPSTEAAQLTVMESWGVQRAIAAIDHTIFKGWQGLKEPEHYQQANQRPKNAAYNPETVTAGMTPEQVLNF